MLPPEATSPETGLAGGVRTRMLVGGGGLDLPPPRFPTHLAPFAK